MERSASSLGTIVGHAEHVCSVAEGATPPPGTLPPAPQAWGGLSPRAMRRVREYVEVHLGESIDLSILAGVVGLSVHHLRDNLSNPSG